MPLSYFINNEYYWLEGYLLPVAIGVGSGLVVLVIGKILTARRNRLAQAQSLPPRILSSSFSSADPFQGGAFGEKRTSLRRQGNPIAILISDSTATTEPGYGWVVDRSMGGLCVSVEAPVKLGTILSVRPTNAPETCPWVQVEVRRCREEGKQWELGCQFLKTPSWGVLLLFG